jgi:hypothetical protein
MYQTTVTIGRNIGTEPMRARDWLRFANSVGSALHVIGTDLETHTGTGSWTDAQGVTTYEDSMRLSVRHETTPSITQLHTLQTILASLALTYGQDAIALSTARVILVTPSRY